MPELTRGGRAQEPGHRPACGKGRQAPQGAWSHREYVCQIVPLTYLSRMPWPLTSVPTPEPLRHQKKDLASLEEWATYSHNRTEGLAYDLDTPEETIFASNNTCALVPETTVGPYYVTGELIRQDITEGQAGAPLHLDMQFVDINTCEPVPSLITDVWHCNATGVYSGVSASGEGGLNTTL